MIFGYIQTMSQSCGKLKNGYGSGELKRLTLDHEFAETNFINAAGLKRRGGRKIMQILVGCEESGVLSDAFRGHGHEAYSCDLEPTRGNPSWHYMMDVMKVIRSRRWDLIVLHPPCTALAVSGNRWYGRNMIRSHERVKAIRWTCELWDTALQHADRVALENPISVVFNYLPMVQYIQPWEFGHGETKKTGFARHNLPKLVPTNIVSGREPRVWKMPPSPTRKRDRSVTYQGIADAIATQWGLR